MHKRVLSWILVCCLVCVYMPAAVSAAEFESEQAQLINILEFGTPNESGNYYVTTNSSGVAAATFTLPYGTLTRYFDMYISTAGRALKSVGVKVAGTTYPLTFEAVSGTSFYRVYGEYSGSYASEFTFYFDTDVSGHVVQFYSLYGSALVLTAYGSPSTLSLETYEKQTVTQQSGTSTVMLTADAGSSANGVSSGVGEYAIGITNNDWRKFDTMTFSLMASVTTINSVAAFIGNTAVPFEVSYIQGNMPDNNIFILEGMTGINETFYNVTISVDLSNVNRTLTDQLYIDIAGTGATVTGALYDSRGFVVSALPEAELTWLQKIWKGLTDGFQDVVDAITGDVGSADEFQGEVDDKADELETMAGIMDSVDTPDEFDPDITISGTVNDGLDGFGPGLVYVITSPYIFPLIGMSLTLAFVSYALFGKRG